VLVGDDRLRLPTFIKQYDVDLEQRQRGRKRNGLHGHVRQRHETDPYRVVTAGSAS
jgi:hypothetical protein